MGKITITTKQMSQFNFMLAALKSISKDYQTPEQIRRSCRNDYGLDFNEAIEYSYENIQNTARHACKE